MSPVPFDLTAEIKLLLSDIVEKCPLFSHIIPENLMINFSLAKKRGRSGLFAKIVPSRFEGGELFKEFRGNLYEAIPVKLDGNEIRYIITFCLPRFLDLPPEDKISTVFHELYHISERFDGDLRRFPGKYRFHGKSRKNYEKALEDATSRYFKENAPASRFRAIALNSKELIKKYGEIQALFLRIKHIRKVDKGQAEFNFHHSFLSPAGHNNLYRKSYDTAAGEQLTGPCSYIEYSSSKNQKLLRRDRWGRLVLSVKKPHYLTHSPEPITR